MSNAVKQVAFLACRQPLVQFQRTAVKINIQRPKKPHYDRARVIAATQPKYEEEIKTQTCFQRNPRYPALIQNPYDAIIAREVFNWLEKSRMVAFFHLNSIKQDELFPTQVLLHKQNMHLKSYGKKIIKMAVEGTRYEAILPLVESKFCIVFSSSQNVKQLIRITRKVPQMILMGGIVEDTLLSRNELVAYAEHPGLVAAQAELVQTLNTAATNLVQQLEAHQNNFVNILDVYAKSGSAGEAAEGKEPTESNEKPSDTDNAQSPNTEDKKT